jgi:hypothetical protein
LAISDGKNISLKTLLPLISKAGTKGANTAHLSDQDQGIILANLNGLKPYATVSLGTGKGGRTTLDSADRATALKQTADRAEAIALKLIAEAQMREDARFEHEAEAKSRFESLGSTSAEAEHFAKLAIEADEKIAKNKVNKVK